MSSYTLGLIILLTALFLESMAQVCLKYSTSIEHPTNKHGRKWLILGVGLYCIEIMLYTLVLNRLNVSIAFPIGSLSFVGVAIISHVYLREKITSIRWFGIASIVLGSILVSL
jgi:undecaprenyl phosphate-alpha-L-ara4N flippase subunit ArnE